MQGVSQRLCRAGLHHSRKLSDVKTGAEGTITVAGNNGHHHLRVCSQSRKTLIQFSHHLRMQDIQRRIGQPNNGQRGFFFQTN